MSLKFIWWFIDTVRLPTNKLVNRGFVLEKLRIYFRKFFYPYLKLSQPFDSTPSQFYVNWFAIDVSDATNTWFGLTEYDWLYSKSPRAWPQKETFTLFPSGSVAFSVMFTPGFVVLMDKLHIYWQFLAAIQVRRRDTTYLFCMCLVTL